MSYMSPTPRDDNEARRRATWGLMILALVAVLIVAIMVFFVGTSGGKKNTVGDIAEPSLPSSGSAQPTGSATHPSSTARSSPSRSKTPTTASATHPKATSTANPCPSTTPCAVDGDDGQAVDAVNAFRVQHGLAAVPGSVSANAQQCALHEGSGPTCVPHYSWEPVATRDGAKAVGAVTGNGSGSKWLLDPGMKSFSVGWAYAPGGGGHYEFVILKVT